ncbi:MAG: exodeoxyribonuclease VII small subunit [Geminicoccaceae bacterium]|nr:exodeoxyribonuclease VII small subunit [Geminicoccaceae bacterium]
MSEARADDRPDADTSVGTLSFEQALGELEQIVQKLERGQLDLEASIQAYERGTVLRRHCETKLEEARLRVEKLTFTRDGEASLQPFDEGDTPRS